MGYAVQLYFDAGLEASLTRVRSALAAAGVTPTLERLGDRPHVSLAVLEDMPVQRCVATVEKFAETQRPFPATFAAFGAFPTTQGVVYLTPTPAAALLEAQRRMHRLLSELGAKVHEHYLPDTWIPHSTIGFELSNDEVALALSWLHGNFKALAGTYSSIGLIEFVPVKRLATFELRALTPA
jgi:2'-5' RNA ligase